jgi:DNA-binding SARP family transcriptional activator
VHCDPTHAAASELAAAIAAGLGVPPPAGVAVDVLARALVDALVARSPSATALVLDDVHHLPEGSDGAALLDLLVARLPPLAHLVLGSRRKPPIALARLVAHGAAVRLQEEDLAFSAEEQVAFAELRGVPVEVLADVGAWPAIAELAASAGHHVVQDYLWEEALASMDVRRRRRLAVLSAIGRADDEVFRAALGEPVDLAEVVDDVPLVSADAGAVELHALWTEPLRRELDDEDRHEARRRAAATLWARGELHAAFLLRVEAGAWDEVLAGVVEVCAHVYVPVATDVLAAWAAALRAGPVADDGVPPELLLLEAVLSAEQETGLAAALPVLADAGAAFRERGDAVGELACITHRFAFAYALGDEGVLLEALGRTFELELEGHPPAAAIARLGRSGLADFTGDHQAALTALDAGTLNAHDAEWQAIRTWMRADLLEVTGHPDLALEAIGAAPADRADQLQDVLRAAWTQALWAAGRVDQAVRQGEAAAGRPVGAATRRAVQATDALATRYHAYLGDATAARAAAARARALGPPADRIIEHRLAIGQAAIAVLDGDEDGARKHLQEILGDDPGPAALRSKMARRVLPLVYVLLPASRPTLDMADLGPSLASWRELARVLVAARDGEHRPSAAALPPLDVGSVRAALPLPWAVELAVLLEGAGRPEARDLFVALGTPARSHAEAIGGRDARRLLTEVPATPEVPVRIRLLGPAELWHGEVPVDAADWRRERVRQLLAHLVVHRQASREAVADAHWPDLDAAAGANNLRSTLSQLLNVLTPDRRSKEASYFVAQRGRLLTLTGLDRLEVDVWDFEADLDEAEALERAGAPSAARVALQTGLARWRGPFLADTPVGWAESEAERLRLRFLAASVRAGELALAAGDDDEAVARATAVLDAEPWSEAGYRLLAAAQLAQGDRTAARRTLDRAAAMLDELGMAPDAATQRLERRVAADLEA